MHPAVHEACQLAVTDQEQQAASAAILRQRMLSIIASAQGGHQGIMHMPNLWLVQGPEIWAAGHVSRTGPPSQNTLDYLETNGKTPRLRESRVTITEQGSPHIVVAIQTAKKVQPACRA